MASREPPLRRPAKARLHALTGLRFVAAGHVVLYHFSRPLFAVAPEWVRGIVASGHAAVDLFFILSGFVLSYSYLNRDGTLATDRRTFWIGRVARVYPLYLFALLLSAAYPYLPPTRGSAVADAGWLLLAFGSVVTMTQSWVPDAMNVWNGPSWSLSVEAFFYALFPILAVPLARLRTRTLLMVLAACWGLALMLPLGYVIVSPAAPASMSSYDLWSGRMQILGRGAQFIVFTPATRLPEFLIGMALGVLFLRDDHMLPGQYWTVLSCVAALGITGAMAANSRVPYLLLNNGLLAPLWALLIYSLATGHGPFSWLLSRRLMTFLGDASYSVYLLQVPVLIFASELGLLSLTKNGILTLIVTPQSMAAYLTLLIGASLACHHLIERRLRQPVIASLAKRFLGDNMQTNRMSALAVVSSSAPM